jgi:uncharacterized membrane protein YfcA
MTWAVGIVIGLALGLTGAGGSVFAVPLLIWAVGLAPSQAIGISLGAVAAGALFGVIARIRSGEIQWLPAAVFATLGAAATPAGTWLNQRIDERWLMAGFGVLVLIIAVRLWLQARKHPDETRAVRASVNADEDSTGAVCRMINNQPFKFGLPCIAGLSGGAILTGILSGLFGVIARIRSGEIQWLPAAVFATLGAAATPAGTWLNHRIDEHWLMAGFGVLVLIIAVRLWLQARKHPDETRAVRASVNADEDNTGAVCRMINNQPFKIGLPCIAGMSGGAILTGILSGLFGVGGGFIIVPTLLFLTGIGIRQAVATSLVVISAVGISGFTSFLLGGGNPGTEVLLQVAGGSVAGMTAGILLSRFISGPVLQKFFAVLMLLTAAITLYTTFA